MCHLLVVSNVFQHFVGVYCLNPKYSGPVLADGSWWLATLAGRRFVKRSADSVNTRVVERT